MSRKKNVTSKNETAYSKKEMLANSLKLPKDLVTGAPVLTLLGRSELWIENYRGIIEYTSESIVLQAKICRICVTGTRLNIAYYTNEDMKITGVIQCVRYC